MVFSDDGSLYYCASDMLREAWNVVSDRRCWIVRMDVETGEREKMGLLNFGEFKAGYVARAARTRSGRLLMGDVINHPTRLYEYQPQVDAAKPTIEIPLRRWG